MWGFIHSCCGRWPRRKKVVPERGNSVLFVDELKTIRDIHCFKTRKRCRARRRLTPTNDWMCIPLVAICCSAVGIISLLLVRILLDLGCCSGLLLSCRTDSMVLERFWSLVVCHVVLEIDEQLSFAALRYLIWDRKVRCFSWFHFQRCLPSTTPGFRISILIRSLKWSTTTSHW